MFYYTCDWNYRRRERAKQEKYLKIQEKLPLQKQALSWIFSWEFLKIMKVIKLHIQKVKRTLNKITKQSTHTHLHISYSNSKNQIWKASKTVRTTKLHIVGIRYQTETCIYIKNLRTPVMVKVKINIEDCLKY